MRAQRLQVKTGQLLILTENNLSVIEKQIEKIQPKLLILDSIQTVYLPEVSSAPGSVSQLRECTGRVMQWAKRFGNINYGGRSCHERRLCGRSTGARAYGGYGIIF